MKIVNIDALQVFDSRGNPTLDVQVTLEVIGYRSHLGNSDLAGLLA